MGNLISEVLFLFQRVNWITLLDLALVTGIFYALLITVRDTQAMVLLRGIIFLVIIVLLLTSVLNLPAFSWLIKTALPALLFAIPVIFTPEIRRGLTRLGQVHIGSIFLFSSPISNEAVEKMVNEVVKACANMASLHYGALIVIERRDNLRQFITNGVHIGAQVSAELLMQIFYPNTPLHDGAAIIVNDRLEAAACVLPLSPSRSLNRTPDRQMGLRHRAALGICEASDAIALVVSEETGQISLGHNGRLIRRISVEKLNNVLTAFYRQARLIPTSASVRMRIHQWFQRGHRTEIK